MKHLTDIPNQVVQDALHVRNFCAAVNNLGYHKGLELEHEVLRLLLENGFTDGTNLFLNYFDDITPKYKGKSMLVDLRRNIREGNFVAFRDLCEFQTGLWVINQPLGNSDYPDKLLIMWGRVVVIEEKSSEKSSYRFNNTCPHPKTVYIFSDKRHEATRMVQAKWFIDLDQYSILHEALAAGEAAHKEARNKVLKEYGLEDFFIQPYSRPQFGTSGGYNKIDFVRLSNQYNWSDAATTAVLYQLFKGAETYLSHK